MLNKDPKHKLGKGISSLLDDYNINLDSIMKPGSKTEVLDLPISDVEPNPDQPRKCFDDNSLQELALSIKEQGVLQPILVEKADNGKYRIIAGERRYRASKIAGLRHIPSIVKSFTNAQRLEVALIENIQRENLNPIEEAQAYYFLLNETGMRQDELAAKVGKARSSISNSVRLLQLPDEMQDGLVKGIYTAGHARALLTVVNPADREILFRRLKEEHLSVRQMEKLALEYNNGKRSQIDSKKEKKVNRDVLAIQDKFVEAVGAKVELKGSMKKGKITIPYSSVDELQRIFKLISPGGDIFEE